MRDLKVKPICINNKYVYILIDSEDNLLINPTKFLKSISFYRSQNTVRKIAFSLLYYYKFLKSNSLGIEDIAKYSYSQWSEHVNNFLVWLKKSNHRDNKYLNRGIKNKTCNMYLSDVFAYFDYLYENEIFEISEDNLSHYDKLYLLKIHNRDSSYKVKRKSLNLRLKNERYYYKGLSHEEINSLINNTNNVRDKLILTLLSETGLRIGELLGIHHSDLDFEKKTLKVVFRDDNENNVFAKNRGNRELLISNATFQLLLKYMEDNSLLLTQTSMLFVKLKGNQIGKPLDKNDIYSLFRRLYVKTGIKSKPHDFRHFYAQVHRDYGWHIETIQYALGHKSEKSVYTYLGFDHSKLNEAMQMYYDDISDICK